MNKEMDNFLEWVKTFKPCEISAYSPKEAAGKAWQHQAKRIKELEDKVDVYMKALDKADRALVGQVRKNKELHKEKAGLEGLLQAAYNALLRFEIVDCRIILSEWFNKAIAQADKEK